MIAIIVVLAFCVPALAQDAPAEDAADAAAPAAEPAPAEEPAPPAEAPAPADEPKGQELTTANEVYDINLKELQNKVDQLKEKIFRSKARLLLLKETILRGVLAGSKAVVSHRNTLGSAFKLESVAYYLDGSPIFGKIDIDGSLNNDKEIEIYNGPIQPGNHMLSVYMVYRGTSPIFVYVDGIQIKLKSSYTFKAEEGKITDIKVQGYDRGGVLAKFDQRPSVKFKTSFMDLEEADLPSAQVKDAGGAP